MNGKIVLLVEDNPDDVDLTLRSFKKNNFLNEVVVARDGVTALESMFTDAAPRPLPSLILLDLKLPRLDGFEVLRRIREDSRTQLIPVVVLTSSGEDRDKIRAYQLGANSFLRKPVNFSVFLETLRHIGDYWLALNEAPPSGPAANMPASLGRSGPGARK
jgi:two-component system, response regulator